MAMSQHLAKPTLRHYLQIAPPDMLHLPPETPDATTRGQEEQTKPASASSEKGQQISSSSSSNTMSRARPNAIAPEPAATTTSRGIKADVPHHHHHHQDQERPSTVLTVWRKSLLPSCSGFTVFDASGALAFRVDCYDSSARRGLRLRRRTAGEVVLMDVAGTPLLTVRRRRSRLITSLGLAPDRWLIFDGDGANAAEAGCRRSDKPKPFLSVRRARRHALFLGASASSASGKAPLAYVTPLHASSGAGEAYVVEGSYGARACAVRDARSGDAVAEVRRKERVGDDVFRLVAGPRLGAPLAMALVIALDEMFAAAGASSGLVLRSSLLRRTWSA